MADDNGNFELTRRKALAGLGTIGVASAGAGLGTSAFFSDTESFNNNQLTAGELDLFVDYATSVDQGDASNASIDANVTGSGEIDGDVSAQYDINDVKPGDSGKLVFCPKVVDNPAWIFAGSSGVVDYENGHTEPEKIVDDDGADAGSIGSPNDGKGYGELSEAVQVTVSYCKYDGDGSRDDPDNYTEIRELNNPSDYTLADLALELQTGFLLDGDTGTDGTQAYPGSADSDTQEGPCICIEWNVPTSVGNEIQTDSLSFDVQFSAVQERHNGNPANPFSDLSRSTDYSNDWKGTTIANPTDGTVLTNVDFGDQTVAVSFTFQDDDDGLDFLDTSDYSATNLPMAIDADDDGTTDFQLAWNPSAGFPDDPFAYINHPDGSSTDAPSTLPAGYSAVKTGNTITYGLPKSDVGTSFRLFVWASTGGEGPVVEIDEDSNTAPEFFDSTNYVQVTEPSP